MGPMCLLRGSHMFFHCGAAVMPQPLVVCSIAPRNFQAVRKQLFALENFKQRWGLFRVACDQAEEFVESVKQRIGSECLVDEATGSVAVKSGAATTALPPISAVRLQHGGTAGNSVLTENTAQ